MRIDRSENGVTITVQDEGEPVTMSLVDFVMEWEWADGFESATEESITDQEDHTTSFEQVIKYCPSGKFFRLEWDAPRWEDSADPDSLHYSITEVKAIEKTITTYE